VRHRTLAVLVVSLLVVCLAAGTASAEIGVVNGTEYDEEFDFERPLEEGETEAVVSRTMARVEYLREREFNNRPEVESIEQNEVPGAGDETNRTQEGEWNDVVWKAMMIVGDDRYANQAIADTFGSATAGFYEPGGGVDGGSDSGDEPKEQNESPRGQISLVGDINEPTLAHELVHVMQDQYYNLTSERLSPPVQDEQLSRNGVIEGEAQYITSLYEQRCSEDWQCYIKRGGDGSGGTDTPDDSVRDAHIGILFVAFQPYSDGPQYVHELVQQEGWGALDDALDKPPRTSREIIHRESHERPGFSFEDEAKEGWSLFDSGREGYDIAGEASVFVGLWYQSHPLGYGLDVIDTSSFRSNDEEYSQYNYVSEVSEGLAGDRIYPYFRETDREENDTGFVWMTTWDSTEDAELFAEKYGETLEGHNGDSVGDSTWVLEGDFAGAYHIAHDGRNVTVVQGPTLESLGEIRPSMDGDIIDARPLDPGSLGTVFDSIFPSVSLSFSTDSPYIPIGVGVIVLTFGSVLVVFRLKS